MERKTTENKEYKSNMKRLRNRQLRKILKQQEFVGKEENSYIFVDLDKLNFFPDNIEDLQKGFYIKKVPCKLKNVTKV